MKKSDIQSISTRQAVLAFFTLLGYSTENHLMQTPAAMGFAAEGLIHEIVYIERLANEGDGELQVYLIEMKHLTAALTHQLGRALKNRAGNFLLALTADYERIDFVLMEQMPTERASRGISTPQVNLRPRVLTVNRRNPSPVDLRVLRLVHSYIERKVNFHGVNPCELGQQIYFQKIVERLMAAIRPDESQGEPPLMPLLNRYAPIGSTDGVDFKTTKPVLMTQFSHVNAVAADTQTWEQSAAFRLEQAVLHGVVNYYVRNEGMAFSIPYEFMGVSQHYEPDYMVRLSNEVTLVLEIKGYEDAQDQAKHEAARRWVTAVNNWGKPGKWEFHVNKDPQMLGRELEWRLTTFT